MDNGDPERLDALLDELTRAEKASLTGGDDVWHLPAVDRVGLGRLKVSDGPSGVRGAKIGTRRSMAFPCGTAAGSTWDTDLVTRYGTALAAEARSKGVHVLLGPTVCIVRTPLAGRTFESFSEDPHLTARLAVAYISGVQGGGVACCVKHFACNDQEFERMTISAEVDDRTLREIHLPAFEAAVGEAGVWAVMSAYNRVNGTYAGEHPVLLGEILKGEWDYDGIVMSDWFGTHSTLEAARAGLDLEMPGPPQHLGAKVAAAVEAGDLDESVLEGQARRLLRLMARCGLLDDRPAVEDGDEAEVDDPGRRELNRAVAVGGMVLLRNDGILPLAPGGLRSLALIGPNAELLETGGGGSASVAPFRYPSLVDELRSRLDGVDLVHEPGCRLDRDVPTIDPRLLGDGLRIDYFANPDLVGPPAATDPLSQGRFITIGDPAPGVAVGSFSLRVRGTLTPDVTGPWELGLANTGVARILLDGKTVLENLATTTGTYLFGLASPTRAETVELEAARTYDLAVEYQVDGLLPVAGFRLAAARPAVADAMDRAVAAAAAADVAIVVVGSTSEWETEGADRKSLRLLGDQDELLRRVLAANPRTVVVVNAGSPVEMPWLADTAAVVMAWYPGEEGAPALADILTGALDPGGRLPVTFPRRLEDTPAHGFYPGSEGKVVYGEGILVGYRHFDTEDIEPEFCFGHGLSYTTFAYGDPVVADGASVVVRVPVTNTGDRRGSEVVQLYVADPESSVARPDQELKAFAKVALDPGETETVTLTLDDRAFAFWDEPAGAWKVEPGPFELRIGSSSRAVHHRVRVDRPGS